MFETIEKNMIKQIKIEDFHRDFESTKRDK